MLFEKLEDPLPLFQMLANCVIRYKREGIGIEN